MADTDSNNDGIADFVQGGQSETDAGLTVSTPAHEYFTRYFDAYRDALVTQRDAIGNFEPLPDIVTYTSATETNRHLTTNAPDDVVQILDKYISYLDDYKGYVDRSIKKIQANEQV